MTEHNLPEQLRIKATMISMGERISFNSDVELMIQAAAVIELRDKRIAELEAVLKHARDVIKSECGFGGENIYDPWAIVASIDALGVK